MVKPSPPWRANALRKLIATTGARPLMLNKNSPLRGSRSISASASLLNGTRCSRLRFMRSGGTVHTPTKLLQNPQGTADIESGFYSKAVDYVDGRFYISTTRLTGNDEAKEKLMLAFGK